MIDFQAPATLDVVVYQGQDWGVVLEFYIDEEQTLPLDLTGYEVDMDVRESPLGTSSLVVALSTREAGEGAGRATIVEDTEGAPYRVRMALTAEETAELPWRGRPKRRLPARVDYFYDVELTAPDGSVRRVLRGKWTFDAEITVRES